MRQRPKQANYLEKFKEVKDEEDEREKTAVYDKDGHRVQVAARDPSPIVNPNAPRGLRGSSNVAAKKKVEDIPPLVPGAVAVVKQYKSLDDVPDGLPESPKWGTKWVPRSVAVSPRAGYQEEEDGDNYWTSTVKPAAAKGSYGSPAPVAASINRGDLSPREEAGYSTAHNNIPRQSYQPMRRMPQNHDEGYEYGYAGGGSGGGGGGDVDGDYQYEDDVDEDERGGSGGYGYVRPGQGQGQGQGQGGYYQASGPSPRDRNTPERRAPAAATATRSQPPQKPQQRGAVGTVCDEDDDWEDWERDSIPGRRDTPPIADSDYYGQRYDDEDYDEGGYSRGYVQQRGGGQGQKQTYANKPKVQSSGYGARPPPSLPSPRDRMPHPQGHERDRKITAASASASAYDAAAERQLLTKARASSLGQSPGKTAPLSIDHKAPPLPSEMRGGPQPQFAPDSKESLYYSRQPRSTAYRPYSLAEWKMKKPNDYVEIKPTLQPDLNSQELVARRANHERVKEFSKQLLAYNQKALQAQRKLPRSSESSELERASQIRESKRERAIKFAADHVPKPKPALPLNAAPAHAGGGPSRGMSKAASGKPNSHRHSGEGEGDGDDEEDWGGKSSLDDDYMLAPFGVNNKTAGLGGMSDVEFRRLEALEQKHSDSQRQIAAIKRSLLM